MCPFGMPAEQDLAGAEQPFLLACGHRCRSLAQDRSCLDLDEREQRFGTRLEPLGDDVDFAARRPGPPQQDGPAVSSQRRACGLLGCHATLPGASATAGSSQALHQAGVGLLQGRRAGKGAGQSRFTIASCRSGRTVGAALRLSGMRCRSPTRNRSLHLIRYRSVTA